MGWAKYAEDNMEMYNRRMYQKRGSDFPEKDLNQFKRSMEYGDGVNKRRKEYILLLQELRKIEKWTEMVNELLEFAASEIFTDLLVQQKDRLQKNRSEFINYRYDPRFEEFRETVKLAGDSFLEEYTNNIGESYLGYFIDKLKVMENKSSDDTIKLNYLIWDLNEFLGRFMSIDIESIDIPVIQYIREVVLDEGKQPMIKCKHCNRDTYLDYKTCIECKYPNEVI